VVRWLEQHAPTVERTQERPVEHEQQREAVPEREAPRKIPPTAYQRQFMQAIREMQSARREFAQLGGQDALTEALLLRARVNEPARRIERLDRELAEHQGQRPSRLRFSATEAWIARGDELVEDRRRAVDDLDAARRNRTAFEHQRDGRPLSEIVEQLADSDERVRSTATRTADVEQQLVRLGPAALDEQRLVRVLGRRDDLQTDTERRRYDQLAGRLAVFDVVRTQRDEPGRWLQTTGAPDRDVAIWRGEHDMSLSRPQQRVVQEHRQELERTRDTGYDLGR
jgi:hypothetical protein